MKSIKKNFFAIIIAVICVGGGVYLFTNVLSASDKESENAESNKVETEKTVVSDIMVNLHNNFAVKDESEIPKVDLRGYGKVSGRFVEFDNFSVLEIKNEDKSKAEILQAKYESDLRSLGGVVDKKVDVGGKQLKINDITDQGATVSFRQSDKVFIISASTIEELQIVLETSKAVLISSIEFDVSAQVPMYLDSWDQFAFRFYYRPWEMPKDEAVKANYDIITSEFDYAQEQGDLGFVLWAKENMMDFAEGMNNDIWWDWAARAAEKRDLPLVVNSMSSASTWLLNDYREETYQKMPQYCGSYHSIAEPYMGGTGHLSWNAEESKDIELALLQNIVGKYAKQDNVIEFLEPHGELQHGAYDVFLEYGPIADKSYRKFLKQKYKDLSDVSKRWYGSSTKLKSWDQIKVPEVASFAGWGEGAVDLTGKWKINYETLADETQTTDHTGRGLSQQTVETIEAPSEWFDVDFNDESWAEIIAPGTDKTMFLHKRPAVFRQDLNVSSTWLNKQKRVWIYLWDLNYGKHNVDKVYAYMNGTKIGEDLLQHATPHWCAFEVTDVIKPGANQLSIRLPKGFLAYRVYLSGHEPKQYPALGEQLNSQWVDFVDWQGWTRLEMARRGIEMIREVDPNRSIICMAPDGYFAGIKELCEDYGARFHNTGHMGGHWNEFLPMLMRSSDLPFSLEPGGPASDLPGFKRMMGHYLTEGVNAIHYFIHIGSIIWEPQIKAQFEKMLPMLKDMGRIHIPKSEAALLMNERVNKLTSFPWGKDPNTNLQSGYWAWPVSRRLTDEYTLDGLSEKDFARGNAEPYKLIVDINTSIMEKRQVKEISDWVKNGGIFVTFIQTGRHTPEKKDSWPISQLTGYNVIDISKYNDDNSAVEKWHVSYAPGQTVFNEELFSLKSNSANGLKLQKASDDCEDLLLWDDGSVAAGLRPYGKGYVITLGMKFSKGRIWHGGTNFTYPMFREIFRWAKIKPVSAYSEDVLSRCFVSNNGLFDAWTLWNENKGDVTTELIFRKNISDYCINVETGEKVKPVQVQGKYMLDNLKFKKDDSKMFLAPRKEVLTAGLNWFKLQRNWWKGTRKPSTDLPEYKAENAFELTENWKFQAIDSKNFLDVEKFATVDFDDSDWDSMRLGVWIVPEELDSRHVVFRKKFKVPQDWSSGKIYLWMRSWFSATLGGSMRVWLDGKEIKPLSPPTKGIEGMELDIKAGTEHILTVEIQGTEQGSLCGPKGNAFISYIPQPIARKSLDGKWQLSKDGLSYEESVYFPDGKWNAMMARRSIIIPEKYKDMDVYLHMDTSSEILGGIINGHWTRRHHHALGSITHLNITPWIKFGQENEFEIVNWTGNGRGSINELSLYFYEKKK